MPKPRSGHAGRWPLLYSHDPLPSEEFTHCSRSVHPMATFAGYASTRDREIVGGKVTQDSRGRPAAIHFSVAGGGELMSTVPYPARCTNSRCSRAFTEDDPPETCPDCRSRVDLLVGQVSDILSTPARPSF